MRKIILAALAGTAALAATPAAAQDSQPFNGGHVEAITGYDHITDGDDGILYGIGAGYDFRTGNVVLGIEGEVLESTAGECAGGICVDAGRDFYIGGRVGVEVTQNNVEADFNLDGIRAGAGLEWLIPGSPLSLRAEYRYTNYELGVERHQGTLGLALRF